LALLQLFYILNLRSLFKGLIGYDISDILAVDLLDAKGVA
jgi:hypothetical protein